MTIKAIAEIQHANTDYALIDDNSIRGGYSIVLNLTERNNISVDKRKYGMKVYVQSTDLVYILQSNLTSWLVDTSATQSLQSVYNNGNEIITTDPVLMTGQDDHSDILKVRNAIKDILTVNANGKTTVETIVGKEYSCNLVITVQPNNSNFTIDITDKNTYRAIKYVYTISNSDGSGYEFGDLYVIHNENAASLCSMVGNTIDVPCGVIFSVNMSGNNVLLNVTTDGSIVYSRIIHLFKIAVS